MAIEFVRLYGLQLYERPIQGHRDTIQALTSFMRNFVLRSSSVDYLHIYIYIHTYIHTDTDTDTGVDIDIECQPPCNPYTSFFYQTPN